MQQELTILHRSTKGLPHFKQTLPNVIGNGSFPGLMLAALHPYRDYEEVQTEMSYYFDRKEAKRCN